MNAPPHSNLPIVQHLIAAYKLWHEFLPHIPKDARYTLGEKIDLAKFFLQILWEIGALDNKKYILLSEKLDSIGKMLGGWLKGLRNKPPA
jgi:hypothetical protein